LYSETDIARLQQILALRQLNFGLDAVKACLNDETLQPQEIVARQLAQLRGQIVQAQQCAQWRMALV
jgi:MerR family transcriptional regulator, thiopeptide resistance regulator